MAAAVFSQGANGSSGSSTTSTCPLGSPVAAGATILVMMSCVVGHSLDISITDDIGSTYVPYEVDNTLGDGVSVWVATNVAGGASVTVTAETGGPAHYPAIVVAVYDNPAVVDVSNHGIVDFTVPTSAAAVATASGTAIGVGHATDSVAMTAGAGWTQRQQGSLWSGSHQRVWMDRAASAAGSYAAVAGESHAGNSYAATIVLREPGNTPSGLIPNVMIRPGLFTPGTAR